jgi:hypothetical protein
MPRASITLPPADALLQRGRIDWLRERRQESERIFRSCLERLPSLVDRVRTADPSDRYEALQDLAACAVNARTQWEQIEAIDPMLQSLEAGEGVAA